ncbi:hypothetical protein [Chitinophaga lutea]|uniref:hypothetical protein n=1 Tax=Chitinophaga lutea TaxID=2488634 RepID=UPI000F502A22|nr:hypothetical protein [Chitinophaga lutea]
MYKPKDIFNALSGGWGKHFECPDNSRYPVCIILTGLEQGYNGLGHTLLELSVTTCICPETKSPAAKPPAIRI